MYMGKSVREGVHQHGSAVPPSSQAGAFDELMSLILDDKEQYCDQTSGSCLETYYPTAASHLTGFQ